jgi:hypothetical protein
VKKVIIGTNSVITSQHSSTRHAEIDAIERYLKKPGLKIKTVDILVIGYASNGQIRLSRPCFHCLLALETMYNVKIRHVYYRLQNGNFVKELFITMRESPETRVSRGYRLWHCKYKKNDKNT